MIDQIKITKEIGIDQAKKIYLLFKRRKNILQIKYKNKVNKNKLFLLTSLYERDIFCKESCNLDAIFFIGKNNLQLSEQLKNILNKDQNLALTIGRFYSKTKIIKLNDLKEILFRILKWSLKLLIAIIDFLLIIIYASLRSLINIFQKKFNSYGENQVSEIYTFFYWKDKDINSIKYYYPDFYKNSGRYSFANMFYGYKFLINGIKDSEKKKNIINLFDFIKLIDIYKSLKDLIYIYLSDLLIKDQLTYGNFLALFNSFKEINKKYYSILIFNIFPRVIKITKTKKLFFWHENQFHHRALALSLISLGRNLEICTYIGSIFSTNYYPYLNPSKEELLYKIWGSNNFIMQDIVSKEEMNYLMGKYNIKYSVQVCRNTLRRVIPSDLNSDKFLNNKSREFTFFMHGNLNELYIMLKRFFGEFYVFDERNQSSIFYIRLHPLISLSKAKKIIYIFKKESAFKYINFKFIDPLEEDIFSSIFKSKQCIFSQSSILNYAISKKVNVIAIKSSFFYNPPIQKKYENYENLVII